MAFVSTTGQFIFNYFASVSNHIINKLQRVLSIDTQEYSFDGSLDENKMIN